MLKVASWVVTVFALPLLFIVYLTHRFIELIFGTFDVMADGFDRAAMILDRLPGGFD